MNENNSRSKELLNKVYDHLDSVDVSKLSMRELGDFLEVVQKGRFLESYGQILMALFGFTPPQKRDPHLTAAKELLGQIEKETEQL